MTLRIILSGAPGRSVICRGPTSDLKTVLERARASSAMITLDVSRAVSYQRVQNGELTAPDFVEAFAGRLLEVHMYEGEEDRHYSPQDMTILGPIVDRLLATACTWWTIELNDTAEELATRALSMEYITGFQCAIGHRCCPRR